MAGIPPPPAHLHPSSPAFAEWMRAVAKGLEDYKKQIEEFTGADVAGEYYVFATAPSWTKVVQFDLDSEPDDGAMYEVTASLKARDWTDPVRCKITKGESDTIVVDDTAAGTPGYPYTYFRYHGSHISAAIKVLKGEKIGRICMWVQTGSGSHALISYGMMVKQR